MALGTPIDRSSEKGRVTSEPFTPEDCPVFAGINTETGEMTLTNLYGDSVTVKIAAEQIAEDNPVPIIDKRVLFLRDPIERGKS